ncbi:MAG: CehA/McbA family metallohydrolase [Rhodobiaceae bacterium]|nr:CehA/McbA family metallohydrolase [Rhodobiaceae bacterium]
MRGLAGVLLGMMVVLSSPALAGELVATRVTAENAAQYVQAGPDAAGGIGDWILSNGSVCAVISGIAHESELSVRGGTLIDLGYCDRADDHYVGAQDLIDSSRDTPVNIERVDAKVGPTSAVIRSFGGQGGVIVETSYRLDADAPDKLFITKRLTQRDGEPSVALYTSIFFNYHSLVPFVASTIDPRRSNGFVQESFVTRGPTEIATFARTADLIVALSPADADAPIAYGWQMVSAKRSNADGTVVDLPFYALADFSALSFLAISEPFVSGDGSDIGLLQLLEVPFTDLAAGDEISFEEVMHLAPRADVAGVTDRIYADAAKVSGRISEAGAVVHIDLKDGTPFTQTGADARGAFSAHLPTGAYTLRVVAKGGRELSVPFQVGESDMTLETVDLDAPSRVALPQGSPMRLTFKGLDGTADPLFGGNLLGAVELRDEGAYRLTGVNQIFLMGTERDPRFALLPPGKYEVYATRGPEYSLEKTEVSVEAGNDTVIDIATPSIVVETPGFLSADFHVHSGPSFDTVMPRAKRVATYLAEGAEVLVATEHETVFDFQPTIDRLGVGEFVATIAGTEITGEVGSDRTPYTLGHANAFPVDAQALAFRRGAFANENRRWREVIADLKARRSDSLIQLNHARWDDRFAPGSEAWNEDWTGDRAAYLDHMGIGRSYNAGEPLSSDGNRRLIDADPVTGLRDVDFDAMEVMNGISRESEIALRRDWLSLVSQGEKIVATANSDSHTASQQVGLPRNMIAVEEDTIEGFDEETFVSAVQQGRVYGTTGPMLEVTLDDKGLGETVAAASAELTVRVSSAPWIDASTLTISVNGKALRNFPVANGEVVAFKLGFEKDSYVTVEVSGDPGEDYAVVYPDFRPYAFTNPIYVDANSDGIWTPPGLAMQ